MAKSRSLWDPLGLWARLGPRLGSGLERLATRGVNSENFARAMQQALDLSLSGRRLARGAQGRLLEAMNLPSWSDIQALSDKLQAVEDRLISLASDLARIDASRAPGDARPPLSRMPPRTRKPPALPSPAPATPPRASARKKPRP